MTLRKANKRYIDTTWELRSYDVWGNARDGYEVNDTYSCGRIDLRIPVEVNNPDTPQQFESAYPTSTQIRKALSLRRFAIELDGDDLTIYVNRARDGYPCGELYCVSHSSLSPIKANVCVNCGHSREDHRHARITGQPWCYHMDNGKECGCIEWDSVGETE